MEHYPNLHKFLKWWAGPIPLTWLMPYFMILLIIGTFTQKDLGLYDAVNLYISNYILWVGPIPTPGGGLILALITFSLAIKFIFFSPWQLKKSGIILSHLGVLILLLGGLITSLDQKEGYMILSEGETKNFYNDYRKRILKISNGDEVQIFPFYNL
ncbi:MAG: hypothetical protein AAF549_09575, partial [Pseudomonadota bacterium]